MLAFFADRGNAVFSVEPLIQTTKEDSFKFESASIVDGGINFDPDNVLPFNDGDSVVLGTFETTLNSTTPPPTGLEFLTLYFAAVDTTNHTIKLSLTKGGTPIGFSSAGDGLTYTLTEAVDNAKPLSPLVSGKEYKLSPRGDQVPGGVYLSETSGGGFLNLVPADESGNVRRTEYQLSRPGYEAIEGLTYGRTYYAVPAPGLPGTYRLAASPSDVYSGEYVDLQGSANGPHLLGFEGVGLLGPTLHQPYPAEIPTVKDGATIAAVDYDVSLAPQVSSDIVWDFENGDLSDTTGTNTFFASPRVNLYWDFENGSLLDTTGQFNFKHVSRHSL